MFQITRSAPVYDVVIIGSGAGGGTVTKVLADMGISVALLEAGPGLNPEKDFKMLEWPYQVGHRGAGDGGASYFGKGRAFGFWSAHAGGWELEGEPYTVAEGSKWNWFRSRVVGEHGPNAVVVEGLTDDEYRPNALFDIFIWRNGRMENTRSRRRRVPLWELHSV